LDDRYRSKKSIDIYGFFRILESLWQECGNTEPMMRSFDLEGWEQYPCITYHIVSRRYAERIKERRPREREMVPDPDNPGEFIKITGQFFEYVVELGVFAKTNDEADALLEKFENFLFTYSPYFCECGVNKIWFEEQLEDEVITKWRDPVYSRRVRYRLRLEKIRLLKISELKQVLVNIDVE